MPFVAWLVLRAADEAGTGRVPRDEAVRVVAAVRGVSLSQARRIIADPCGLWEFDPGFVRYTSDERVAGILGVAFVGRARLVPLNEFSRGVTALKATLMTVRAYRPDGRGSPISRSSVAALVGVASRRTIQRWDKAGEHTELVDEVHVRITHIAPANRRAFVAAHPGQGFYLTPNGELYRRHPDIRRAARLVLGPRRPAGRLNKKLRGERPGFIARGQRSPRSYFKSGARFLKSPRARGMPASRLSAIQDGQFDYAVIEVRDPETGRRRWESARILDHRVASQQRGGDR